MISVQPGRSPLADDPSAAMRSIACLASAAERMRAEQSRLAMDARALLDVQVCDAVVGALDQAIALLSPLLGPVIARGPAAAGGAVINDVQAQSHAAIAAIARSLAEGDADPLALATDCLAQAREAAAVVAARAHRARAAFR